ncbi:Guanine nucleotide-binding protein subunit gamma [Hypsizygus marmoreus]|uniref:Guanine nucleotide-binding protein subunit gamma n=1 Tax=Hypsizygus marmoreus TaxID=39966 RepID=A0A369JLT0_HYPMA|nr:Guanine nucleotide-binding protein subunit gamma [Hypsizygus marmoreus]
MSSRAGGRQTMSELKLRRLVEHNQRLREDLARPRVRVSEASASLIRYCKTTKDHLCHRDLHRFLRCGVLWAVQRTRMGNKMLEGARAVQSSDPCAPRPPVLSSPPYPGNSATHPPDSPPSPRLTSDL